MFDDLEITNRLAQIKDFPETVVVLGSGWNHILATVERVNEFTYKDLFGAEASVPGHDGKLIIGIRNSKKTAFMSGRLHTYEGYSARQATAPVRAFARLGMKELILTAACGGLNQEYRVGDTVILNDIITLLLSQSPLVGPEFIDTSSVFDADLRNKAVEAAQKNGIPYREGSYVYYHGPNFETPSDKRAMRILGADVCGMSMVPETLMARSCGVKVLGLAFVTNLAFVKHDHLQVLSEAEKGKDRMTALLQGLL